MEDDVEVRRLYAMGLNQQGYEVRLAANGADAVERFNDVRPDVIVLDLALPVMTGWEVLDRFSSDQAARPRVVVVSGQPRPETPDPRVTGWLSKPVTIEEIIQAVEQALDSSR